MAAEGRGRGAGRIRQLVFLGDGAVWIWNLAARHFPEATQIVDLFHAREHLHDLARLLEFMLGDHKQSWLEQRLADLDDGDIPAICTAARAFPLAGKKAAGLDTALGYFEHNAHRMRYAHFKKLGMFVGSGAVEAGCKSIVAQRCQLSGMRWTEPCATGILTARAAFIAGSAATSAASPDPRRTMDAGHARAPQARPAARACADAAEPCAGIPDGSLDHRSAEVIAAVRATTVDKLTVANPGHLA